METPTNVPLTEAPYPRGYLPPALRPLPTDDARTREEFDRDEILDLVPCWAAIAREQERSMRIWAEVMRARRKEHGG